MKGVHWAAAATAVFASTALADVDPIVIKVSGPAIDAIKTDADSLPRQGSHFFYKSNGTEL
jgi:hypothetical protein